MMLCIGLQAEAASSRAGSFRCALPGPTCELALSEECDEGVLQANSLDCYLAASTLLGVIHHAHTPGRDTHDTMVISKTRCITQRLLLLNHLITGWVMRHSCS